VFDLKTRICAAIVDNAPASLEKISLLVDFFEVRIDLLGGGWLELAAKLDKPWIACNRRIEEGGRWRGSETDRIDELRKALQIGADIIDIELSTSGVESIIHEFKGRVECLLSYHDLKGTPPLDKMKGIIEKQLAAGADICKVVTTAGSFSDNITLLRLISSFPDIKIIAFAMGPQGYLSRVLSPLAGGYLTYASIEEGKESAPGQVTVGDLRNIYQIMEGIPQ
jgi:3-dehydroquinate dehydratase-1